MLSGARAAYSDILNPQIGPKPKRLEEQVRTVARLRHFSMLTEEAYWGWVKRFVIFHGKRHPNEMSEMEVREFPSSIPSPSLGSRLSAKLCFVTTR